MNDESTHTHQCPECGRKFTPTSQWAYKISTKGKLVYLCRYNCHRAAEKRLEKKTGRVKEFMKSKRPSREVLEADLRAGLSFVDIAKKHQCSVQSAKVYIKAYGLTGIQDKEKPKKEVTRIMPTLEEFAAVVFGPDVELTDELVETVNDMAQHSPSLAEIEQFHTDVSTQELPKVEMDAVPGCYGTYQDEDCLTVICFHVKECEQTTNKIISKTKEDLRGLTYPEPQGMTEEENMSDKEWEAQNPTEPTWTQEEWESSIKEKWEGDSVGPAPSPEPFAEVWQDVRDDITTLRRCYHKQADDDFRSHLLELVREIMGGSDLIGK